MAKIGTIAWHEEQISRLRKIRSEAGTKGGKVISDRVEKAFKRGYNNSQKGERKKPKARYRSRVEYDFLKYIRVVFKWATDNNDLTKTQIEFLLYLYSLGAFTRIQFDDYHKLIGIFSIKTLQKFTDEGWINLWRPKTKRKQEALYVLSQKSKLLCNKIHRYCCGDEDIPVSSLNIMGRADAPRINTYYLDIIKKMNKENKEDKKPRDIETENPED